MDFFSVKYTKPMSFLGLSAIYFVSVARRQPMPNKKYTLKYLNLCDLLKMYDLRRSFLCEYIASNHINFAENLSHVMKWCVVYLPKAISASAWVNGIFREKTV